MFVKFADYELGEPRTVFLSAKQITDPSGPNAEVLTESILGVLKEFDLNINKMKSFVSDGASVMTGIHNGVAARLKRVNNVMLNLQWICHRLALASCNSENETEYIKEVEGILTQIWTFFEYSPKCLNNFIQIQTELHNITLAGQTKEAVAKKVRKACRARWLSLEQSVQSVYKSYIALLHTFQELQADALALGLYKKIKTPKFLGTLFILNEVLPHLSTLSKIFQTGAQNFARIEPAVQFTQFSL